MFIGRKDNIMSVLIGSAPSNVQRGAFSGYCPIEYEILSKKGIL